MIAMLDTSEDLEKAQLELGLPVEQLLTPLTRFRARGGMVGIDNGAYSAFDEQSFLSLLEREMPNKVNVRWVVVPDVVGSARRTLEVFSHWYPQLCGWPLALAAQDGQEDLPIPWDLIDCLFIGGSTQWKLSAHAAACIKAAKLIGKWVHVGRVNTPARFEYFEKLGADSIDGTGLSRYSWMRKEIHDRHIRPPSLFDDHTGELPA